MKNYQKKYYEQPILWNYDYLKIPQERERLWEVINMIPTDVRSVLDVGCGNGVFINTLIKAFPNKFNKIIGVDFSSEALRYVKTEKIYGNISNLPFENKSFDLVTSLEVLEHLSEDEFNKGILELQRVSKKYIIITVPNDQNLEELLVRCPKCYCWFNLYSHVRSFNKHSLCNLLEDFKRIEIKEIGPAEFHYHPLIIKFYHICKKPSMPKIAICPQCGYQVKQKACNEGKDKKIFLFLVRYLARIFFSSRKKKWLLALYERTSR